MFLPAETTFKIQKNWGSEVLINFAVFLPKMVTGSQWTRKPTHPGVSNPPPLKFVSDELQDFSLTLSSIAAGATDVTYTFEYTIVTANPYDVFYALAHSNAIDTSAISNPIDLNKVRVEINGAHAAIDNRGQNSYKLRQWSFHPIARSNLG